MTAMPPNLRQTDSTGTDDLCPTRQSLLSRLKDWEDDRSWREFFDTYWRLIYRVALKSGLNEAEAQDVVQETVFSVAKKMKDFRYDPEQGSFKGWLLQLTGWRISNQFARRGLTRSAPAAPADSEPHTPTAERLPDLQALSDLEQLWDREWEDNLLQTAMDRVRRKINPTHFQVFDLCVARQLGASEAARFLGINVGQVYLAKHRVSRLVQKEITRLRQGVV